LLGGGGWILSVGDNVKITLVKVQSYFGGLNWSMVDLSLAAYRIKNTSSLYYFAGTTLSVNYTDLERVYDSNFTLLDWSLMPNSTIAFTCQGDKTEYYYIMLLMINADKTVGLAATYNLQLTTYFDVYTAQSGVTLMTVSVIPFAVAVLLLPVHSYYFSGRKKREKVGKAKVGAELEARRSEEIQKSMDHGLIKHYGSEFSVAGSTFRVYWFLVCKRQASIGLREIQRALGFSSPSSAVYQLEKLIRLGLVEKNDMGDYVVHRIVKIGFLRSFLFLGTHALPKDLIYCMATLVANFLCVGLLLILGLSPLAYLALLPGVLSSIVFLYEAIETWNYKRGVMAMTEHKFGEMEKSKIT
jgi:hypothetical protein